MLQDTDGQFIGLTVAEDVAFALENDCVEQEEMFRAVDEVAEVVDIKALLGNAPTELSGGQKQRVSMAGVLVDDVVSCCLMSRWQTLTRRPASGLST